MTKKQWAYLMYGCIMLFFSIVAVYFWYGEKRYNKMVADFTRRKIDGLVVKSVMGLRGFYYLDIKDNISNDTLKYYLPKSWFFRDNHIATGDSVSKQMNNKVMEFYKLKDRVFEKCCKYEIGM